MLAPIRLQQLRERLTSLQDALFTGALSVRHGDKQVMYRSSDELKKAIDALEEEIRKMEGRKKTRLTYFQTRRGY